MANNEHDIHITVHDFVVLSGKHPSIAPGTVGNKLRARFFTEFVAKGSYRLQQMQDERLSVEDLLKAALRLQISEEMVKRAEMTYSKVGVAENEASEQERAIKAALVTYQNAHKQRKEATKNKCHSSETKEGHGLNASVDSAAAWPSGMRVECRLVMKRGSYSAGCEDFSVHVALSIRIVRKAREAVNETLHPETTANKLIQKTQTELRELHIQLRQTLTTVRLLEQTLVSQMEQVKQMIEQKLRTLPDEDIRSFDMLPSDMREAHIRAKRNLRAGPEILRNFLTSQHYYNDHNVRSIKEISECEECAQIVLGTLRTIDGPDRRVVLCDRADALGADVVVNIKCRTHKLLNTLYPDERLQLECFMRLYNKTLGLLLEGFGTDVAHQLKEKNDTMWQCRRTAVLNCLAEIFRQSQTSSGVHRSINSSHKKQRIQ